MSKRIFSCLVCLLCAALTTVVPASLARAQTSMAATVAVPSVWFRVAPDMASTQIVPVFTGDALTVSGRDKTKRWLRAANADGSKAGWLPAAFIKVQGDLAALPELVAAPYSAPKAKAGPLPSWISVPAGARKQFQALVKSGRPATIFTVAGDCNSEPDAYIRRLANGAFDVSRYPQYADTVRRFESSFLRRSYAASGSFSAPSMFDPNWTDPAICYGEGPLVCEVWRSSASIVFISLGTGDQFDWKNFNVQYTQVITTALARGALPVLFTKADDLETRQHGAPPEMINSAIRAIARERQLPLIDFAVVAKSLPNNGLRDEGNTDFHLNEQGSDTRILATLQVLQALSAK
jgi:hypothetical protein